MSESGAPKTSLLERVRARIQNLRRSRSAQSPGSDGAAGEMPEGFEPPARPSFGDRIARILPHEMARKLPRSFEPLALAEWASQAFQGKNLGFYGKLLTILLCTFFLADLSSLWLGNFIPEPPPARFNRYGGGVRQTRTLDDLQAIWARNLFNSQGLIPGEDQPQGNEPKDMGGPPVRSSLPFNLVGTVILRDPARSVATIEDKSAQQVFPVRIEDTIPNKAKILEIEPYRVIFVNVSSGRREFIELPRDPASVAPRVTVSSPSRPSSGGGIERVAPNQFNVSRQEVDKAIANLNQVLTQARCVPNFENGLPAGYKCFQIVPGSIYDKLGLQNGDTICGINGQSIADPSQAFALFNELKTSSHLELCVKRSGRQNTFSYDIR